MLEFMSNLDFSLCHYLRSDLKMSWGVGLKLMVGHTKHSPWRPSVKLGKYLPGGVYLLQLEVQFLS